MLCSFFIVCSITKIRLFFAIMVIYTRNTCNPLHSPPSLSILESTSYCDEMYRPMCTRCRWRPVVSEAIRVHRISIIRSWDSISCLLFRIIQQRLSLNSFNRSSMYDGTIVSLFFTRRILWVTSYQGKRNAPAEICTKGSDRTPRSLMLRYMRPTPNHYDVPQR